MTTIHFYAGEVASGRSLPKSQEEEDDPLQMGGDFTLNRWWWACMWKYQIQRSYKYNLQHFLPMMTFCRNLGWILSKTHYTRLFADKMYFLHSFTELATWYSATQAQTQETDLVWRKYWQLSDHVRKNNDYEKYSWCHKISIECNKLKITWPDDDSCANHTTQLFDDALIFISVIRIN